MAVERRIQFAQISLKRDPGTGQLTDILGYIEWQARDTASLIDTDWRDMKPADFTVQVSDISQDAKTAAVTALNAAPLDPK